MEGSIISICKQLKGERGERRERLKMMVRGSVGCVVFCDIFCFLSNGSQVEKKHIFQEFPKKFCIQSRDEDIIDSYTSLDIRQECLLG